MVSFPVGPPATYVLCSQFEGEISAVYDSFVSPRYGEEKNVMFGIHALSRSCPPF